MSINSKEILNKKENTELKEGAGLKSEFKFCVHCSLPLTNKRKTIISAINGLDHYFCCRGCEYVFKMINSLNLNSFYKIREVEKANSSPASPKLISFKHFDDLEFINKYTVEESKNQKKVLFFLSGIYCSACVWLIEKLAEILSGIDSVNVDYGNSTAEIVYRENLVDLSKIAKTLDSLGYTPTPLEYSSSAVFRKKEDQKYLIKLAVAAVCAGNTMMIAISLYQGLFTGIQEKFKDFLHWTSLFLTLPAIFYSATPFYKAAIGGIRAKVLHIDLPISIGLTVAFLVSVYNTAVSNSAVYYDSICMLVFLLLLGRWLQRISLDKSIRSLDYISSFLPFHSRKKVENSFEEVYSGSLKENDTIQVLRGEEIPVDGIVVDGSSKLDTSIITGESRPVEVGIGTEVFAASKNLANPIEIKVSKTLYNTRVANLLALMQSSNRKKPKLIQTTDIISSYFVATVLVLSVFTLVFWSIKVSFIEGLENALSLLIITCPCALGLAAPIALSVATQRAAKKGIFIRGRAVIEELSKIKDIFFDKTGTLTTGELNVVDYFVFDSNLCLGVLKELIFNLEKKSTHPTSKALLKFSGVNHNTEGSKLKVIKEFHGKGIYAEDGEKLIRIGSWNWVFDCARSDRSAYDKYFQILIKKKLSPVVLSFDDEIVAIFGVGDKVKPDAKESLRDLKNLGYKINLVSGDLKEISQNISNQLGIKQSRVYSQASPEEKVEIINASNFPVCMVGDGINDAAALQSANVGIAVAGGAEMSMKTSDIFLSNSDLENVVKVFKGARKTMNIVYRNYAFSIIYNIIGAIASIAGYVNPLFAAILMPLSSLTVIFSSLWSKNYN